MANILIFGDSITQGYWDKKGGWADRIRRKVYKKCLLKNLEEYHEVYNLGRAGDTSADLLLRIENEIKARLWDDPQNIIVIAIGTNDSILVNGKPKINENDFEKNITKIIDICQKYTKKIHFISLLPINEELVNPMSWSPKESYTLKSIQKYNLLLEKIVNTYQCHFIDVYTPFSLIPFSKWLEDGVHPNTYGHNLLYKKIYETLSKKYLTP